MSQVDLKDIADRLASEGLEVKLKWVQEADPNIRYRISEDTSLLIPDYLQYAPKEAIEDEICWILDGHPEGKRPMGLRHYCTSDEFCEMWQSVYIDRTGYVPLKWVSGVIFVESNDIPMPTATDSKMFRVIACRPEWANDGNIEYIALKGLFSQIKQFRGEKIVQD